MSDYQRNTVVLPNEKNRGSVSFGNYAKQKRPSNEWRPRWKLPWICSNRIWNPWSPTTTRLSQTCAQAVYCPCSCERSDNRSKRNFTLFFSRWRVENWSSQVYIYIMRAFMLSYTCVLRWYGMTAWSRNIVAECIRWEISTERPDSIWRGGGHVLPSQNDNVFFLFSFRRCSFL